MKIVIPAYVCFAAVFIYICSFSPEVFLSLSALGILIAAQILFLSRRVKVGQYKSSDLAEEFVKNENAASPVSLDGDGFKREARSQVADETGLWKEEPYEEVAKPSASEPTLPLPSSAISRTVPEASAENLGVEDKSDNRDEKVASKFETLGKTTEDEPEKAEKRTSETAVSNSPIEDEPEKAEKRTSETVASDSPIEDEPEKAEKRTSETVASDSRDLDEKVEDVVEKIKELLERKEYKAALKTVDQFLEINNYTFNKISQIISLIKLKGDCEFYLENHEKASRIWLLLFNKNYLKPDHPMFFRILEDIIEKFDGHKNSLYFLLILLNQYRRNGNLGKMDETYYLLEKIYLDNKDYDHLTKTCQSHIAVKEKLGDVAGQLPLLDDLGKLYYDQGNQENSKKCYEQRVILEELLNSEDLTPVE